MARAAKHGIIGLAWLVVALVIGLGVPTATAGFGGATKSGHGQVTCDTDGELLKISTSTATQPVKEIVLSNPTTTLVRVYSTNGNAINQGTPICSSSSCVGTSVNLKAGPNVWRCATDSGTQAVYLLGVE
jgi:hypothetical protein